MAWSAEPLTLNTRRQEGVSVQAVHGPREMMFDAGAAALTVARACVVEPSCREGTSKRGIAARQVIQSTMSNMYGVFDSPRSGQLDMSIGRRVLWCRSGETRDVEMVAAEPKAAAVAAPGGEETP